jgi:hypothetical protein
MLFFFKPHFMQTFNLWLKQRFNLWRPMSWCFAGIAFLALSLAPACGLVQRSTKARENTSLQTAQLQEANAASLLEASKTSASQELHFEDSSGSYELEIWPKGKFSFQPGQGFETEAEKVRIKGQQSRLAGNVKQHSEVATQKQSESTQARAEQQQVARRQRSTQERNPAWGMALILLAVLLIFERFFTKSRAAFVP